MSYFCMGYLNLDVVSQAYEDTCNCLEIYYFEFYSFVNWTCHFPTRVQFSIKVILIIMQNAQSYK